jgi:hypothetical protein
MPNGRDQDIAVVGSPSTNTELTVDLLQEAIEERLVGALVAFEATQNGSRITSIGQIVGIELRNRWHEDSVFRNLVKRTGEIPPITNRQDTRTASLVVGATFKHGNQGYEPDVLGMVPATGTRVARVDQALLDKLLAIYRQEIFYLGRAYANEVLYPMWFKHFSSGAGGAGEAYHIGVFGKTGSGKSGLAKMLLLAYARHPELGILIIDPQGEFSLELSGTMVGEQKLPVQATLNGFNRPVNVYRIQDLQLDDWDLFEELLVTLRFTERVGIPAASTDNSRRAAEVIRTAMERESQRLDSLGTQDAMRAGLTVLTTAQNSQYVYATATRATPFVNYVQDILNNRMAEVFQASWTPIASLFATGPNRRRIYGIVADLIGGSAAPRGTRAVVAVDLSERGNPRFWSEDLQRKLIKKLLDALVAHGTRQLADRQGANVLVLLDEAGRHAPAGSLERGSEAEQLRSVLRRAVRETRKFGIGWFFISQTLGGIDNEILQQLRILFFGFGLALGDEFRKLGEFAGGDERAMELYQSFRDPHSAPRRELREFPFMAVGPVSPLAFSGRPLFFSAFIDPQEFLRANNLPKRQGAR